MFLADGWFREKLSCRSHARLMRTLLEENLIRAAFAVANRGTPRGKQQAEEKPGTVGYCTSG
jgi:dethiobiotin synthetase